MRCATCRTWLGEPREHPHGLPGVLYRVCPACGRAEPVKRQRPRKARLLEQFRKGRPK